MDVAMERISPRTDADDGGFSLSDCAALATLPVADLERARRFYAEKLRLSPTPGAAPGHCLYHCGGATFVLVASRICGKSDGTAARSATSYAVSDSGVRTVRAARICASCRCSSAVNASPRALAMNRSSTAQHRLRQLVSPGNRPITFVRRLTSSSDRSSRFVERSRLR